MKEKMLRLLHLNSNKYKQLITATSFMHARKKFDTGIELKKKLRDFFLIFCGVFSAGFGLKGFLIPSNFIDGGSMGLALLAHETLGVNLSLLIILINAPFIFLGKTIISKEFAIKTSFAIAGLAFWVAFFPYPHITNDKLLISVFGGFFLGSGVGLAMRGGAVIDGTEVLAIAISKKSGLSIGDVIMLINVIIFSLAAWLISVETALYAMLTYMAASKTVDFLVEGIEEYTGVSIISLKEEKIRDMIITVMGRGITVYKAERGFGKSGEKLYDMKIIYTIVTRLEVSKIKHEIEKIDPEAFVFMTSVKDMKGGMIKKRRLKD
ncbi:MAG: YitT family protein [Bacteroidota bacterium]